MMQQLFHILTLLLIFIAASGQNHPEAKKILDDFSGRIKSFKAIQTDFTFTEINLREGTSDSYAGKISLKGEKFKLNILDSETFFDGETLWNFLPDVNEVNISEPDEEDDVVLNNPFRIFRDYEERFKYRYIGLIREEAISLFEIDLYPRNLEQEYSRIKIKIRQDSRDLYSIKYFRKDGTQYLIEISNLSTATDLPDSFFTFNIDDHPDVEVIDLR